MFTDTQRWMMLFGLAVLAVSEVFATPADLTENHIIAPLISPTVFKASVVSEEALSHPCARYSVSRLDKRAEPYQDAIETYAKRYQVEPAIVKAVIAIESCYNQQALSPKGAQGLMQLIPETAERFGVTDAFDSNENIRGGTRYLSWLANRYQGDKKKILAAYNAGEGKVDEYGGIPPFAETQHYVNNVLAVYSKLSGNADVAKVQQNAPVQVLVKNVWARLSADYEPHRTAPAPEEALVNRPQSPPVQRAIYRAPARQGIMVRQARASVPAQVTRPAPPPAPKVQVINLSERAPIAAANRNAPPPRVERDARGRVRSVYQVPTASRGLHKPGRGGWQANKALAPQLYKH